MNGKNTNFTGQKFNHLFVIEYAGMKGPSRSWKCLCDCGNTVIVESSILFNGRKKHCGCMKKDNLVGQKFNRLTVLELHEIKNEAQIWKCECVCGNIAFVSTKHLRNDNTKSCGCLAKEIGSILKSVWAKKTRKISKETAINKAYSHYRTGSGRRNLVWNISKEQFLDITSKDCYYCGCAPNNVSVTPYSEFTYSGIDRVDNNIGYIMENVVPCCKDCNYAKRTMTQSRFLEWVERIYKRRVLA